MRRLEEVKLNYRKTKSGEIFVSLDDIINILEKRILTSTNAYDIVTKLIKQLKTNKP